MKVMMPLWSRILLLCVCISLVMNIWVTPGGARPYASLAVQLISGQFVGDFLMQIGVLFALAGVAAFAGTVLFPNPYSLFGSFILVFLLGFISMPQGLVNFTSVPGGLPEELRLLLFVPFSFLYLVAIIAFFKGSD